MKIKSRVLLCLFCFFALSGCGPVATPPIKNYTISAFKTFSAPAVPRTARTLLVGTPIANSGYDTSKIVYVMVPYQLRSYALSEWIAPPAQLLQPLIAQKLQETGYFKAVVMAPFAGATDLRLDIQLLTLEQEFYTTVSKVRLALQVNLVNNVTGRLIASRHFGVEVTAPENTAYGAVAATNIAANELSHQIARFVTCHP